MKIKLTSFINRLIAVLERIKKWIHRQKPVELPDSFLEERLRGYVNEASVDRCMLIVRTWGRGCRLDVSNLMIHAAKRGVLSQLFQELEGSLLKRAQRSAALFELYKRVNPWLPEHEKLSFRNPAVFQGEYI